MGVHDERSKRRIIGAVANFHGNPYQSSNSFLCILSCSWVFILKRQPFFLLMSFFYRKAKAFYYIHSIVLGFFTGYEWKPMRHNSYLLSFLLSFCLVHEFLLRTQSFFFFFVKEPKVFDNTHSVCFGDFYGLWIQINQEWTFIFVFVHDSLSKRKNIK